MRHPPTSASELLRVESLRIRSNPKDVFGLGGLVAALRETDAEVVDLYVLAEGGTVTSVVLTPAGQFLGCVVVPDRREGHVGGGGRESTGCAGLLPS
jgi:hypothetical protein